jgi:hypothetical protein
VGSVSVRQGGDARAVPCDILIDYDSIYLGWWVGVPLGFGALESRSASTLSSATLPSSPITT